MRPDHRTQGHENLTLIFDTRCRRVLLTIDERDDRYALFQDPTKQTEGRPDVLPRKAVQRLDDEETPALYQTRVKILEESAKRAEFGVVSPVRGNSLVPYGLC